MSHPNPADATSPPAEPGSALRICLLGYRSAPFGGGQGIYLRYLSKALLEAGHTVDVISGEPYPQLVDGVRLIKLPGLNLFENGLLSLRPRHLGSWANIVEWCSKLTGGFAEPYAFGRRVCAYLANHPNEYDLIHDNQSLSYGLLELQQRDIPVVATIHHPITRDVELAVSAARNAWQRLLIRRWHSFLFMQKRVVKKLRYITTVSEHSRQDIASAFNIPADSIRLIYNGIDTDVFQPMADVPRENNLLLATASADQPLKGLHYLLRAFAQLREQHTDLKLIVVGRAKEGGATERLIKRLKLSAELQFVHGISTEELVKLYARATVAVVPSLYEGFGLPAGEAMSCGTPLVSADGGALPEVVGDAAVLVPAADTEALFVAIETLLNNPDQREALSVSGRSRIEQKFSWTVAANQLSQFYAEVIAQSHSAKKTTSAAPLEMSAHANS